ncbi:MAG TPA: histidine phosphotransferase family protein [Alphaproteobacteria bacterium]|nr:histidine phosphotransferase family protein [Alphaproteobacteria bacterium]
MSETEKDTVRLLELVASRICHDLISPVSAMANGLEFMEEAGPDALPDAMDLLRFSSGVASAKLRALRMAYGAGGSDPSIRLEDVRDVVADLTRADGKITQEWDFSSLPKAGQTPVGFAKILMCGLLLAIESLPRGGTIRISGDGASSAQIHAKGPDAGPREKVEAALSGLVPLDMMEPKLIHPHLTSLLARAYGFSVTIAQRGDGQVVYRITHA